MSETKPKTAGLNVDRGSLVEQHLEELRGASQSGLLPLRARADLSKLGDYRGYVEVVEVMAALEASGAARVFVIGESVLGTPLFACEFGEGSANEPRISSIAFGGIHAMEWIGVEIALSVCERLAASPPARRVVVVPIVNVDGYRRAEADLAGGRHRYVRTNENGVDLNRNWPSHFKRSRVKELFSKSVPFLGSSGPAPRSEPEVAALCALCDELGRGGQLERALSFHSFGNKVLYPYGGRWRPPVRAAELRAAAESLRVRLEDKYKTLQVARWMPGFFAPGMEIDHLHDAYGAMAILLECGKGGARPLKDPMSLLHPWRWYNPPDRARVVDDVAPAAAVFLGGP